MGISAITIQNGIQAIRESKLEAQNVEAMIRVIRARNGFPTAELETEEDIYARFLLRTKEMAQQLITVYKFKTLASSAECMQNLSAERVLGEVILANFVHYFQYVIPEEAREFLFRAYELCRHQMEVGTEVHVLKFSPGVDTEILAQAKTKYKVAATDFIQYILEHNEEAQAICQAANNSNYFNIPRLREDVGYVVTSTAETLIGSNLFPSLHMDSTEMDLALREASNAIRESTDTRIEADLFWNVIVNVFLQPMGYYPPQET